MELSILMKLRIALVCAAGVLIIGILAWPMVRPAEPFGLVSIPTGFNTILLAAIAFLTGLLAFFLAWPHGKHIAILAAPAGLAVWSIRSGSIGQFLQMNPSLQARQQLLETLQWQPLFWLAIVLAGFGGAFIAELVTRKKIETQKITDKAVSKLNFCITAAIAIVASVLIAQFFIGVFARGIRLHDPTLNSVTGQPAAGQIAFAMLISFGLAAFITKIFLNTTCFYPIIASGIVTAFATAYYVNQDTLSYLTAKWPPIFFSNSLIAVLPIQIVSFGAIGAVAGYWIAIRYKYWRKHGI